MNFNYNGIFGFDVSRYQDDNNTIKQIDFLKMKERGTSFVIMKAGQLNYQDEDFSYNWRESKNSGLPRGSYWFGDKNSDGKLQAQKYLDILNANQWSGEICAIDYETGSWTDWNQLYNFIYEFQRLTNQPDNKLAIYTGYYYWVEHCPSTDASRDWFKKYPLWEAWYTDDVNDVKIPSPWNECLLWQKGTPAIGIDVGVESKDIDLDLFNGDSEKFKIYFGEEISNPPDTGGTVNNEDKYLKATITINIRSSGETLTTNDLGNFNLLNGDIIHAVEVKESSGVTYHRFDKLWRNGIRYEYPFSSAPTYMVSNTGEYWSAEKGDSVWMIETDNPESPTNVIEFPTTLEKTEVFKDSQGNVLATYKGTISKV